MPGDKRFRPSAYEYERGDDGKIKTREVELLLQECELHFLNPFGDVVQPGDGSEIRAHHFVVKHPNIDTNMVARAELVLGYGEGGAAILKVTLYEGRPVEPASA